MVSFSMNGLNHISIRDSTLGKYNPSKRQHKLNSVLAEYFAYDSNTGKYHAVTDYPIISANGLDNEVCRNGYSAIFSVDVDDITNDCVYANENAWSKTDGITNDLPDRNQVSYVSITDFDLCIREYLTQTFSPEYSRYLKSRIIST